MLKTKEDIILAIQQDEWMMEVLKTASELRLPDQWISAGFIRSKVWDIQHGFKNRTPLADVDVVYFDASNTEEATEKRHESLLKDMMPCVPWSVKNQARMHLVNNMPGFHSAEHAIACYPETATSIAVKLDADELSLVAPHGVSDLIMCTLAPTPLYTKGSSYHSVFLNRMKRKPWLKQWPQVRLEGFYGQ
ncbi:nucleotidyltransferase family protein [Terribacillus saccharophilus]|uniref:nucleotidyltransferase family protein n=1 Tax=Terribacillus saccharophilus TaxID=361277 RepID=UPI003981D5FD